MNKIQEIYRLDLKHLVCLLSFQELSKLKINFCLLQFNSYHFQTFMFHNLKYITMLHTLDTKRDWLCLSSFWQLHLEILNSETNFNNGNNTCLATTNNDAWQHQDRCVITMTFFKPRKCLCTNRYHEIAFGTRKRILN